MNEELNGPSDKACYKVAAPQPTRPDARLPQTRAGGQELYLRSLDHLGRSSEAKDRKNPKKVKCDGPTDGRTDRRTDRRTDGPTKRGVGSLSTRLKRSDPLTVLPHFTLVTIR